MAPGERTVAVGAITTMTEIARLAGSPEGEAELPIAKLC